MLILNMMLFIVGFYRCLRCMYIIYWSPPSLTGPGEESSVTMRSVTARLQPLSALTNFLTRLL